MFQFLHVNSFHTLFKCLSIISALYVNQVVVSDFLPPSADSFPLLARFYTTITLIMGLSIILTVLSLTVHFRVEPKIMPLPGWWNHFTLSWKYSNNLRSEWKTIFSFLFSGTLLNSLLTNLEHLGSCSLLTILNSFCGLFLRKNNKNFGKTKTSNISYSSPKLALFRDHPIMRSKSKVSSLRTEVYANNRPYDFVYNSACARPIPNSPSQVFENGEEQANLSQHDFEREARLNGIGNMEFPTEVSLILNQINENLDFIAKSLQCYLLSQKIVIYSQLCLF